MFANVSVDVLNSRDYSLTEQCIDGVDDKVLETAVIERFGFLVVSQATIAMSI